MALYEPYNVELTAERIKALLKELDQGTYKPSIQEGKLYIGSNDTGITANTVIDIPGNPLMDRWLRFDPSDHKSLIIKARTTIKQANGNYRTFKQDTSFDMSSFIAENGKDYFVYMDNNGELSAYTSYQSDNTKTKIGRFHTLCVNVGDNVTMIAPTEQTSTGNDYLIKPYNQDKDPDFYTFYKKKITNISTNSYYNIATIAHPLSGYEAGDILPESVFCLNFYPSSLYEDAMLYDVTTNIAVDTYLQSGTGHSTRSAYNATHTVSRQQINHQADMLTVGKRLLSDKEFTSIALGSNECTNIAGSADITVVGGHSDTNGRRMISAIGCEETCGYLWQWLEELSGWTTSSWGVRDGNGAFGQEYGDDYALLAGGRWGIGALCGSRCRDSGNVQSSVAAHIGSRGASRINIK